MLILSGLSIISCNSNPTDWLEQDSWSQSGPVCYSTPQGWLYNQPPPGGTWFTFLRSNNGLGIKPVIDSTESADLTIAMLQPPVNGYNPDDPDLGAFTESAVETLMADYGYLDSGSMIKTEVSGYPAYEISYHCSNAGIDVEGRFILIAGSTAMVIITYIAPLEKWDHFGPIYDRTKSNIYFAAEKDADGNCKLCLPYYR